MKNILNKMSLGAVALLMILFGLNKFIGFIPSPPPDDPVAQSFMGAMFTSYLFVIVALTEIVGGILLLIPKTRILGWLLLLPVVFNIIAFHVAHDFIGNGIWLFLTLTYLTAGYFLKENLVSSLKPELV